MQNSKSSRQIIRITGISGSGKTTLGKILAKELNYTYIELDDYYLPNKPKINMPGTSIHNKKNWDTLEAIDIVTLQRMLIATEGNIILSGFALPDKIFPSPVGPGLKPDKPTFTICLEAGKTSEEIILKTIEARKKSKLFTGEEAKRDEMMVREIVYPYYLRMLQETTINAYLCTYENNERISIDKLIQIILSFIQE